jgi:S1-C subfamily serine protease
LEPVVVEPAQRSGVGVAIIAAVLVAFVVGAFAGLAGGFLGARLATYGLPSIDRSTGGSIRVIPPETDEPVVAAAAAAVPSVVNIDVRGKSGSDSGLPEGHPNSPIVGNGSGVAYKRADGGGTYILTNNHVVEGATSLVVRDESGSSTTAKLVGRDPETDIAVLLVERELPLIEVGDSSELIVGQTVVAIGSPFGLEHSVTSGVVSALGRSLPDFGGAPANAYPLVDVIQTDAAINPGNSGGALVDIRGYLMGINTAIYSDSGASGGIGFAVPVNTAVRVADQLVAGGEITHPFLGVIGQTVTPELAEQENLSVQEGAYVIELTKGSGAELSDLAVGDVITSLDGDQIRTMDDLILQVRRRQVGQTVTLTVARGENTLDVEVEVGDKPDEIETPSGGESTPTPEP